ncbi:MAG TPA: sulfite exporter TauE/SafE family protein [Bacteroidales bacterium]|jgi:hypothetical protein|nr:sulfite exporter TauE/SafE family protein [Bacteroidales bacterium]
MSLSTIALLIVSGLFVGFINTLAGGGTIISISVFMFLGLPPMVANGTNRIPIFLQNLTAVTNYSKKKILNIRTSLKYAIPVAIGSVIGGNIVISFSEKTFNYFFIAIILFMIVMILLKPKVWLKENPTKINTPFSVFQWILLFIIGIYGGLIHVGIGYFLIAIIVLMRGYDLLKANAIKNLIVLIYVPFSLIPFIIHEQVRYDYGLVHAIGNIIGAYIASQWASRFGSKFIRYVLLLLLFISCLQILSMFYFDSK